jgi:hypothetical protein
MVHAFPDRDAEVLVDGDEPVLVAGFFKVGALDGDVAVWDRGGDVRMYFQAARQSTAPVVRQ